MKRRLLLLLAYCWAALFLIVFSIGDGGGSLGPVAVLGSWAVLLVNPAIRFFSGSGKPLSAYVFLVTFPVYLVCLLGITMIADRAAKRRGWVVGCAIHGAGSVTALMVLASETSEKGLLLYTGAPFDVLCYVLSVGCVSAYFFLDWKLSRPRDRAEN